MNSIARRSFSVFRVVTIAGIVVTMAASGCASRDATTPTTSVTADANGFHLQQGAVEVTGTTGTAPAGTRVSLSRPDQQIRDAAASLITPVADPARIMLNDGALQPNSPLTITFTLDERDVRPKLDAGHLPVVFLESEDGSPDLVGATWDQSTSTLRAQLPHLSFAWPGFLDIGAFVDQTTDALSRAFGLTFPEPDCVGKTAQVGATTYSVSAVSDDVAWPCPRTTADGGLSIELASNSPYLWKVRTDPVARSSRVSTIDLETYPAGALHQQLLGRQNAGTVLLAGQSATFDFAAGTVPRSGALSYDVGTYIVGLVGYGLGMVLGKLKVDAWRDLVDNAQAVQCLADVSTTINALGSGISGERVGQFVRDIVGCVSVVGGTVLSFLFGALTGAVLAPIVGLISPRLAAQNASFTVTGSGTDACSADGFRFENVHGATPCDFMIEVWTAYRRDSPRGGAYTVTSLKGWPTIFCTDTVDLPGAAGQCGFGGWGFNAFRTTTLTATAKGYGAITLGMTKDQVLSALSSPPESIRESPVCVSIRYATASGTATAVVKKNAVITIATPPGTRTDRHVGDGSTPAQVQAAYDRDHTVRTTDTQAGPALFATTGDPTRIGHGNPGDLLGFAITGTTVGPPLIGGIPGFEYCSG